MKKVFILSNLGTPRDPSDKAVGDFLKEFLYDPAVIPLPAFLRYPLVHWWIAPRRAGKSAEKYKAIWRSDGSPLLVWSQGLQREVQKHVQAPVLLGMRYGEPSLRDALKKAKELGAEQIVMAPLYPQFAEATSGSTDQYFRELAKEENFTGQISVFPAFPSADFFIKPVAAKIQALLQPSSHLLLTYHGLPVKQLKGRHCQKGGQESFSCCELSLKENISCYRAHCLATTLAIARKLGLSPDQYTMSFQSRFGRDQWMAPHTEDLLRELPAKGKKELVVAAPSFVADCLETAEELGIQGQAIFRQAGGQHFTLVDCVNDHPDFARGLAQALSDKKPPSL